MDEHQHFRNPTTPPTSGDNGDINSLDVDINMVIPDTPDRVHTKQLNTCRGPSNFPHNNSTTSRRASKAILDRGDHAFGSNKQTSKHDDLTASDFGNDDQNQRTDCSSAPFIFKNIPTSKAVEGGNLKLKEKQHSNHPYLENDNILRSRSSEKSYHHHNSCFVPVLDHGDIAKGSRVAASPAESIKPTENDYKARVKIGNGNPVQNDAKPVKRLVRNGFISPRNIEKAKTCTESSSVSSGYAESNGLSGGYHNVIDVDNAIAKANTGSLSKGKGVLIHPSSPKGHGERGCDARPNDSCNDVLGKRLSSSANGGEVPIPSKRQKKVGSSSRTPAEKREMICLSSGGESLPAKSILDHRGRSRRTSGSSIAVSDLSSEPQVADNDNETRSVQLEMDEMMARVLQEQLYNEMPEASTGERVPAIAEEAFIEPPAFRRRQRTAGTHVNIGARPSNSRRGSPMPSLRNRLLRRGIPAGIPPSRVTRLRARINHLPSMVSYGGSGGLFPSDMDVDMRMELLEAFEAVADEDIMMVNQLLHSDREFSENDYEMLLALDENNHEHLGASVAQIANLPESTIHVTDCESIEVCSICLETPAIGDTVRHLPCLHKYHKDCIDPWLRRKRSCPVCKSDI